ncbi:MAG TPA: HdeD family acid-resistance protein [Rhizomicrobium sp.]|nr:HdeD family acid-resistance protein [Rhizomicrobium sp.]
MSTPESDATGAILVRNWWAVALRGFISILFGLIAFVVPGVTMLSLVLVFSAYMLVDGVMAIIAAVRAARRHDRWSLLTFEGILDLAAGTLAFLWPGLTVLAFVLLVAAWALASGAMMVTAAFRLRAGHGRWWLGLGGLASIIYGGLLIVAPLLGALVLTWWLGAYAIVFGAFLLAFALKLHSVRSHYLHAAVSGGA